MGRQMGRCNQMQISGSHSGNAGGMRAIAYYAQKISMRPIAPMAGFSSRIMCGYRPESIAAPGFVESGEDRRAFRADISPAHILPRD